ncbi:M20/M25/M40 family metallo-hydrolase [Nannocystaceae bacterium ST9]
MRPHWTLAALLLTACPQTPTPQTPTDDSAVDVAPQKVTAIELPDGEVGQAIAFLADDAQEGRAPGSEADKRVQHWVAQQLQKAGLEPAGDAGGFFQTFAVGDGVRLREGKQSGLSGPNEGDWVVTGLLPFGHDTGELAVEAKLVFVGYGIPADDGPGDYAGIEKQVKGAIVVALAGALDPHASPSKTRPQSKLIAARDRGAVGFVLWDPESDAAWPNHGAFSELDIPALAVGKQGSAMLRELLRVRGDAAPKLGATSKVKVSLATPIEPVMLETANVIARLPGSSSPERKQIVIGAHMDHLGWGTSSSLAPGAHEVHNGADDNASGVAVLVELAEALAKLPAEQRTHDLVFVAFGAEEMGLLGSAHMVAGMTADDKARTLAMINFDMVGRLREQSLVVNGMGTASEWPALIEPLAGELSLKPIPDGWGPSDHSSFYGEGMPVLHLFTGAHEDYHKPSDDIPAINVEGAAAVGELAGRIVIALLDRCDPLTFVKTDRPQQGAGAFKVSLGTMPDYAAAVDGLALAGVREGGPAALAGLQKGDVIKKIGAREIHGIDDYMASFAELVPGEAVEVVVDRAGEAITVQLTPAAPRR